MRTSANDPNARNSFLQLESITVCEESDESASELSQTINRRGPERLDNKQHLLNSLETGAGLRRSNLQNYKMTCRRIIKGHAQS